MINKAINVGNTIGKGMATMNLIIAIIICLILGGIVLFLIFKKEVYTKNVSGTVIDATCKEFTENKKDNPIIKYNCSNIKYSYIIDETSYDGEDSILSSKKNYIKDDNIELQYNPNKQSQSRIKQPKLKIIGYILIIVSIVIFLISYAHYYFVSNVRGAGSVYTAYQAYNYLKSNKGS